MSGTIIHIGYPKTATTWFFQYFYPCIKNSERIYFDDLIIDYEKNIFELRNSIVSQEDQSVILMSHVFSGLVNFNYNEGYYRKFFINHLKKHFPEATIVIFLRNQLDFLASGYSSYVMRGGTFTVEKLFGKKRENIQSVFSLEYLNYCNLIELYQNFYGKENVHVFCYEEFLNNNINFLEEFIVRLNLEVDMNLISTEKVNEKFRKRLIWLVRQSNFLYSKGPGPKRYYINIPWLHEAILKKVSRMNKNSFWGPKLDYHEILGPELEKDLHEYFSISNNKLSEIMGYDQLKKHGYPL